MKLDLFSSLDKICCQQCVCLNLVGELINFQSQRHLSFPWWRQGGGCSLLPSKELTKLGQPLAATVSEPGAAVASRKSQALVQSSLIHISTDRNQSLWKIARSKGDGLTKINSLSLSLSGKDRANAWHWKGRGYVDNVKICIFIFFL